MKKRKFGVKDILIFGIIIIFVITFIGFALGFFGPQFTKIYADPGELPPDFKYPEKVIKIDNINPKGIVVIRAIGSKSIEISEVDIYDATGSRINIGDCPNSTMVPGTSGTCTIDIMKCPTGIKITAVAPDNEDTETCP